MGTPFFAFGENRDDFPVPVLNERVARAGAGLLFLFAFVVFMNAWLLGNFQPVKLFVVAFLLDFTIRVFVNPRFAPSLIMGHWMVRKQQPEWTGAPQKRFAWAIGFGLSAVMFYLVVIQQVVGPVNLLICALCLTFLFFETAFGICIGCWIYNRLKPDQARLCPGNVCDYVPEASSRIQPAQFLVVAVFLVAIGLVRPYLDKGAAIRATGATGAASVNALQDARAAPQAAGAVPVSRSQAEEERCKVPEFAKAMGHEEIWKKHNNCL